MSGGPRSEPVRSCVGCRRRHPRSLLVRLTRSADGIVADGPSDGRGAWVCRGDGVGTSVDPACLDAAFAKRGFARAWRCEVTPEDERRIRALVGPHAGGGEVADVR